MTKDKVLEKEWEKEKEAIEESQLPSLQGGILPPYELSMMKLQHP